MRGGTALRRQAMLVSRTELLLKREDVHGQRAENPSVHLEGPVLFRAEALPQRSMHWLGEVLPGPTPLPGRKVHQREQMLPGSAPMQGRKMR
jgi:hypothetical protein